ncbi:MAG: hypothetical protein IH840_00300 [Candidatus Heimdallarchaeota archaeon]|nr:hypothetical protein [Candidatus Heimdallarchaeota archaeon]
MSASSTAKKTSVSSILRLFLVGLLVLTAGIYYEDPDGETIPNESSIFPFDEDIIATYPTFILTADGSAFAGLRGTELDVGFVDLRTGVSSSVITTLHLAVEISFVNADTLLGLHFMLENEDNYYVAISVLNERKLILSIMSFDKLLFFDRLNLSHITVDSLEVVSFGIFGSVIEFDVIIYVNLELEEGHLFKLYLLSTGISETYENFYLVDKVYDAVNNRILLLGQATKFDHRGFKILSLLFADLLENKIIFLKNLEKIILSDESEDEFSLAGIVRIQGHLVVFGSMLDQTIELFYLKDHLVFYLFINNPLDLILRNQFTVGLNDDELPPETTFISIESYLKYGDTSIYRPDNLLIMGTWQSQSAGNIQNSRFLMEIKISPLVDNKGVEFEIEYIRQEKNDLDATISHSYNSETDEIVTIRSFVETGENGTIAIHTLTQYRFVNDFSSLTTSTQGTTTRLLAISLAYVALWIVGMIIWGAIKFVPQTQTWLNEFRR